MTLRHLPDCPAYHYHVSEHTSQCRQSCVLVCGILPLFCGLLSVFALLIVSRLIQVCFSSLPSQTFKVHVGNDVSEKNLFPANSTASAAYVLASTLMEFVFLCLVAAVAVVVVFLFFVFCCCCRISS